MRHRRYSGERRLVRSHYSDVHCTLTYARPCRLLSAALIASQVPSEGLALDTRTTSFLKDESGV